MPDSSEPNRRCGNRGRLGIPSRVNPASDSEVLRCMGSGERRADSRSLSD